MDRLISGRKTIFLVEQLFPGRARFPIIAGLSLSPCSLHKQVFVHMYEVCTVRIHMYIITYDTYIKYVCMIVGVATKGQRDKHPVLFAACYFFFFVFVFGYLYYDTLGTGYFASKYQRLKVRRHPKKRPTSPYRFALTRLECLHFGATRSGFDSINLLLTRDKGCV